MGIPFGSTAALSASASSVPTASALRPPTGDSPPPCAPRGMPTLAAADPASLLHRERHDTEHPRHKPLDQLQGEGAVDPAGSVEEGTAGDADGVTDEVGDSGWAMRTRGAQGRSARSGATRSGRPGASERGGGVTRVPAGTTSAITMALVMQTEAHLPQSVHSTGSMTARCPFIDMACFTQASRQRPHPVQYSSSTYIICLPSKCLLHLYVSTPLQECQVMHLGAACTYRRESAALPG